MTQLEKAQKIFEKDRFSTENGAVIDEVGDGVAVCSLQVEARHKNAMGNVMGGALFMLGDFAFAVASNFGRRLAVSQTSQITFLRPARCEKLTARAEVIREGRSTVYCEISITDDAGRLVARMTQSGQVVQA